MIFIGDEKVTLAEYITALGMTEEQVFGKFEAQKKAEKKDPIAVFKMRKMMAGESEKDLISKLYSDKGKSTLQNKFLTLVEEGQIFFDGIKKNVTFVEGNKVLLTLESGKKWEEAAYNVIKADKKLKKEVEEAYDKTVAV